jgi:hypothetical protein
LDKEDGDLLKRETQLRTVAQRHDV